MIQTKAAYRNPSKSESENSNPSCRNRVVAAQPQIYLSPRQVARTLVELCEMGLVEQFKDGEGITRYRPTNGRRIV